MIDDDLLKIFDNDLLENKITPINESNDNCFLEDLDESSYLLSISDLENIKTIYDEYKDDIYCLFIEYDYDNNEWNVGYKDSNNKIVKNNKNNLIFDAILGLKN